MELKNVCPQLKHIFFSKSDAKVFPDKIRPVWTASAACHQVTLSAHGCRGTHAEITTLGKGILLTKQGP